MSFDPEELITLEHQTWDALSSEKGTSLLRFLTDDCIMLLPGGMKVTLRSEPGLQEILESEHYVPWKEYNLNDVEVTPAGTDAAVVSYRVTASRSKKDEFSALVSSTWRHDKIANKWLMCFHQQSPF